MRDADGNIADVPKEATHFCAIGAIQHAASKCDSRLEVTKVHINASIALGKYLRDNGISENSVTSWNDENGRTKEDVLTAFDNLIKELKK